MAVLLVLGTVACTGDIGGSEQTSTSRAMAVPTSSPSAPQTTPLPTGVAPEPTVYPVSSDFCQSLADASDGRADLTDPAVRARAYRRRRAHRAATSRLVSAFDDATVEVAADDGWSNHRLVAIANDVCGLDLTPVTMTP